MGDGGWGAVSKGSGPRTVPALGEPWFVIGEAGGWDTGRKDMPVMQGWEGWDDSSLTCLHFISPASRKALRSL